VVEWKRQSFVPVARECAAEPGAAGARCERAETHSYKVLGSCSGLEMDPVVLGRCCWRSHDQPSRCHEHRHAQTENHTTMELYIAVQATHLPVLLGGLVAPGRPDGLGDGLRRRLERGRLHVSPRGRHAMLVHFLWSTRPGAGWMWSRGADGSLLQFRWYDNRPLMVRANASLEVSTISQSLRAVSVGVERAIGSS
jgi:hypothetical protein